MFFNTFFAILTFCCNSDRRGGGGNWGGRQGGWGGREWGGPRDQSYGRDHHPYGRDAYGRDQPYGRDRNRDAPPGPHPYRGSSDRWVNRQVFSITNDFISGKSNYFVYTEVVTVVVATLEEVWNPEDVAE